MKAAAATALAGVALWTAPARADGDGLYGRFDGDLELSAEAGPALAAGGPVLTASAGARYLSTAGLHLGYADALGTRGPRVLRSIALGVEVAPLFLARYASDLERGPARLDLLIDSLAFGVGAFWDQPRGGSFVAQPGLELALCAALPLLPRASGPFVALRAALRFRDVDLRGPAASVAERGGLLSLTVGFRHVVRTHLVDGGDTR